MVTSPGNLISANQYFASKIWTRHSKFKAMRAGSHSTHQPQSLGGPARRLLSTSTQKSLNHDVGGTFFYFDRSRVSALWAFVLLYPLDNSR